MPTPRAQTNKDAQPAPFSSMCCIQEEDAAAQAILIPSEPIVSGRALSEVQISGRTLSGRTPKALPADLSDQVSEFECRLQNSIAAIMEQQYARLSGEVLDILRHSQQKTSLRVSGSQNGSNARPLQPNGRENTLRVPDDAPPLLENGAAAPATMNDPANPPVLIGAQQTVTSNENSGRQTLGGDCVIVQETSVGKMPSVAVGQLPSVASAGSREGAEKDHDASAGVRRARLSSTMENDETVLEELLHAASLKQREKKIHAKFKSKFKSKADVQRNSLTGEVIQDSCGRRLVEHPLFDSTCALAILLNSILIGFSVEWLTTHKEETVLLITFGHCCNFFFLIELVCRLSVYRLGYFMGEDFTWNCFDFLLVVFSVVDFVMWATIGNDGAGSVGSTLKIVKMLRIVRIFRVFRFFKELSLLALMIMDSLRSLVWALLMLTIIIYVFSICFTQNATEFSKSIDDGFNGDLSFMESEIHKLFGSLPKTIYSLVGAMLGGVSWGVVSDALIHMDAFSAVLFFFYICFTVLAVLNVITGVFVDNAVETAKTERDFLIQKEMELREKLLAEMRELFSEMDEDHSGAVSFEELQTYCDDQRVQTYFQALGLEVSDAERLFRLIDTDGSGEVQVAEFLEGCIRLKGEARSIDVNAILWQCRQMQQKLDNLEASCCAKGGEAPDIKEEEVRMWDKMTGASHQPQNGDWVSGDWGSAWQVSDRNPLLAC